MTTSATIRENNETALLYINEGQFFMVADHRGVWSQTTRFLYTGHSQKTMIMEERVAAVSGGSPA